MQPIQQLYPVVPKHIKKYMTDYYSNRTSTFIFGGDVIEEKSHYFEVEPTPEQKLEIKNNFQNKSDYPYEIFLNKYMLNVMEEFDKTAKEYNKRFYLVVFLIGKIYPDEQIDFPNILSNDYLTATYYEITNLELNQFEFIDTILPIRLTNDNLIRSNPEDVIMAENNVMFPNSTKYIKVRSGNMVLNDAYPEGKPQPYSLSFIKDENTNLISCGGIGMYNINFLTASWYVTGVSASVANFIETLN